MVTLKRFLFPSPGSCVWCLVESHCRDLQAAQFDLALRVVIPYAERRARAFRLRAIPSSTTTKIVPVKIRFWWTHTALDGFEVDRGAASAGVVSLRKGSRSMMIGLMIDDHQPDYCYSDGVWIQCPGRHRKQKALYLDSPFDLEALESDSRELKYCNEVETERFPTKNIRMIFRSERIEVMRSDPRSTSKLLPAKLLSIPEVSAPCLKSRRTHVF